MKELWLETNTRAEANRKAGHDGQNILHIVFHSGHAVESNSLSMVLNDNEIKNRYYHIENEYNAISKFFNRYCIITLSDCSREYLEKQDM